LRTFDRALCPFLPFGTHFLWHVLNGLVLFLLLRIVLRAGPVKAPVFAPSADN
jgi:hypothetical protein